MPIVIGRTGVTMGKPAKCYVRGCSEDGSLCFNVYFPQQTLSARICPAHAAALAAGQIVTDRVPDRKPSTHVQDDDDDSEHAGDDLAHNATLDEALADLIYLDGTTEADRQRGSRG